MKTVKNIMTTAKKKKIILTGGGTGGHILPNLALIPRLKTNFDIYYIGAPNSMEEELVKKTGGAAFFAVPAVKFQRSLSLRNLLIPFKLLSGIRKAKKLLKEINPDIVFSKGGYVALPVVMASRKLKIPYIIHESDMSMGLANRLAAKKAEYVCGGFSDSVKNLPNGIHTGAPIRRVLYEGNSQKAKTDLGITSGKPVLLVTGGSSGAAVINKTVLECLEKLTAKYEVIHLTGKGKSPLNNSSLPQSYHPIEFTPAIQDLFALASLCVTRGGAGALFELTALNIPSLIIPLPKSRSSRGDQVQNANYLKSRGYALILEQQNLLPETLLSSIDALSAQAPALKKAMAAATRIDGSARIVELINKSAKSSLSQTDGIR